MTAQRIATALALLAASVVCALLGVWQWHRHVDRSAQVALITANLHADAVPITDLLGDGLEQPLVAEDVWRPVQVQGTWVADSGVQLRNRPVAGANASHALALFRITTDDGAAHLLVVDRGWWRQTDQVPAGALEVPDGETTLVLRLRAAELPDDRTDPPGEVYRIVPDQVLAQGAADTDPASGELLSSAYGALASPAPAEPLQALPDPDTSLRSHLSYAFQWWFFALAIPVAAVVLHRRAQEEAEAEARPGGTRPGGNATSARGGRRRRPSLEDEEDAILDAAERANRR